MDMTLGFGLFARQSALLGQPSLVDLRPQAEAGSGEAGVAQGGARTGADLDNILWTDHPLNQAAFLLT
jgi:hypothetical protein